VSDREFLSRLTSILDLNIYETLSLSLSPSLSLSLPFILYISERDLCEARFPLERSKSTRAWILDHKEKKKQKEKKGEKRRDRKNEMKSDGSRDCNTRRCLRDRALQGGSLHGTHSAIECHVLPSL